MTTLSEVGTALFKFLRARVVTDFKKLGARSLDNSQITNMALNLAMSQGTSADSDPASYNRNYSKGPLVIETRHTSNMDRTRIEIRYQDKPVFKAINCSPDDERPLQTEAEPDPSLGWRLALQRQYKQSSSKPAKNDANPSPS